MIAGKMKNVPKYHEFVLSDRDTECLRRYKKFLNNVTLTDDIYKAAAKLCVSREKASKLQAVCTDEASANAVGALHRLFRIILDLPPKQRRRDRIEADLRQMKFSDELIGSVLGLVFDSGLAEAMDKRDGLDAAAATLGSVDWKIDVNICTSLVGKILEPVITLSLASKERPDRPQQFEVPLSKFHQLRFTTAKLLTEMAALEAHPAMKFDS